MPSVLLPVIVNDTMFDCVANAVVFGISVTMLYPPAPLRLAGDFGSSVWHCALFSF